MVSGLPRARWRCPLFSSPLARASAQNAAFPRCGPPKRPRDRHDPSALGSASAPYPRLSSSCLARSHRIGRFCRQPCLRRGARAICTWQSAMACRWPLVAAELVRMPALAQYSSEARQAQRSTILSFTAARQRLVAPCRSPPAEEKAGAADQAEPKRNLSSPTRKLGMKGVGGIAARATRPCRQRRPRQIPILAFAAGIEGDARSCIPARSWPRSGTPTWSPILATMPICCTSIGICCTTSAARAACST